MLENLIKDFKEIFKYNGEVKIFFSPGRVNLIGEHTDYNGGFVFPCALDFGTYAVVKKREDKIFRMYSKNFENLGIIEFNLDNLVYDKKDDWANYPKGVIKTFLDRNYKIDSGFDVLFFGNIPNGAGLSSSASIEVLTAVILKDLFKLDVDMIEMVKMCQVAENKFIGVNSGIMDQFAVGMGKKDNAILLDCNTLKYEYVPVKLKNMSIIIANTNKKRGLADSKYNERRSSCEEAVKILNKNGINIKYLGELTVAEFEKVKHYITDKEQLKRATHAVTENERAKNAVEFLKKDDIAEFGRLMDKSHISLRDDYEVTGSELDSLVEAAWEEKGTVGSRMTGAGFGGCTVSIVENDYVDSFIKNVGKKYKEKTGLEASFYIANTGDGAGKKGRKK
ncbi:Galactokinase [Fusobacterium vincentii ATCC 49256]|uniref:Galactokinase n=1 Tax=Fusobacterium vincentii ATCC 49256 TaxID=209882 RepID=Q7P7B8_FUSVC|nr:galactokinase [Fusobacterium sp. HMSC064B12]EAA24731.1 Galactokinase [Fusobacterium vincentii ATCC 49256]OFL33039.1 galactokinase [Fusobacterium sp. HMSC064B12]